MHKKCKIFIKYVSVCVLICQNVLCTKNILRIDNYRNIKKEIKEVLCIADIDFHIVIDEIGGEWSKWKLEPSEMANKYALSVIDSYAHRYFGYSKKQSLVACQSVKYDTKQRASINAMFQELKFLKKVEQYRLGEEITRLFSNINNRYVLLISQNGYHYSEEYLSMLEATEAITTIISTATLVGGIAATGFGMGTFVYHKKGISSMSMALLDLKEPKVLFYSGNSFKDNPLADSVMLRQLQSLFYYF
ncbi:MAG: hypothetical protein JW915_08310 [Chitinispirillaceae bacterium]|nr:hypothetical protein [Chitinispirillaceae bacterium]